MLPAGLSAFQCGPPARRRMAGRMWLLKKTARCRKCRKHMFGFARSFIIHGLLSHFNLKSLSTLITSGMVPCDELRVLMPNAVKTCFPYFTCVWLGANASGEGLVDIYQIWWHFVNVIYDNVLWIHNEFWLMWIWLYVILYWYVNIIDMKYTIY